MSDQEEMGALWARRTDGGLEYLTGVVTIEGVAHKVVVFKNKKKNEKHPDWRIFKSRPRPALNDNGTEKVEPQEKEPPF